MQAAFIVLAYKLSQLLHEKIEADQGNDDPAHPHRDHALRKKREKRLGDVLKVRHGKSQHGVIVADGKYPILASGGEIGRTNSYLYDRPSVLIGRKGTIDSPQYVDSPFWTVDTLFFTEIANDADAKFVFYKFTMIRWRSYNEASGVPSLNAKTIENIEVSLPPLPE
jgi:type I restriction enzyme S subunit